MQHHLVLFADLDAGVQCRLDRNQGIEPGRDEAIIKVVAQPHEHRRAGEQRMGLGAAKQIDRRGDLWREDRRRDLWRNDFARAYLVSSRLCRDSRGEFRHARRHQQRLKRQRQAVLRLDMRNHTDGIERIAAERKESHVLIHGWQAKDLGERCLQPVAPDNLANGRVAGWRGDLVTIGLSNRQAANLARGRLQRQRIREGHGFRHLCERQAFGGEGDQDGRWQTAACTQHTQRGNLIAQACVR